MPQRSIGKISDDQIVDGTVKFFFFLSEKIDVLTINDHPLCPGDLVLHRGHLARVLPGHVRAGPGQVEGSVPSERSRTNFVIQV